MSVTGADKLAAGTIVANWMVNFGSDSVVPLENMIAAALAAEREKARAPFLALADELEADAKRADDAEPVKMDDLLRMITAARVSRSTADRIRRAAEDAQ